MLLPTNMLIKPKKDEDKKHYEGWESFENLPPVRWWLDSQIKGEQLKQASREGELGNFQQGTQFAADVLTAPLRYPLGWVGQAIDGAASHISDYTGYDKRSINLAGTALTIASRGKYSKSTAANARHRFDQQMAKLNAPIKYIKQKTGLSPNVLKEKPTSNVIDMSNKLDDWLNNPQYSKFKQIPAETSISVVKPGSLFAKDYKGALTKPQPYAYAATISDIDADSLSISELNSELNNVASNLNYNSANVLTKKIPTRLVPSNIGTPFLQHARAFIKANPNKTLQDFPHLWYKGEPYVVKTRTRINKQTGAKQNEITLEPWRKRVLQRKSTKLSRKQRIQEQSEGVAAGTAVYEKIKQLRELNAKEVSSGLPRSRLRDMDLDHKNALRTVSIYTDGLPPTLKKLVYEDLGGEGLFTGDHEKNLILRHRSVHKKLYPELKALLKTLNHKHSGFKSPEERYRYYNTINPKTGLTPLQEYAEAIYKVEETGNDLMNDLLKVGTEPEVPEVSGFKSSEPSNEHKDLLIEILGGEADYKAFIHKIKSTPGLPLDLQREFILGEIEHAGKRALEPLTEERAQQMLDEISPDTYRP